MKSVNTYKVEHGLFRDVARLIDDTRKSVAYTVNSALTYMYWKIGKRVNDEILRHERAEYGSQIVASLTQQLSWSHIIALLPLKDSLQREFYVEMCRLERKENNNYLDF